MAAKKLPKAGDRIPVEKFHISEMNVRADEPFGEAEEDKQLIANLRRGRIIGPFKARPEGEGYGVVVGRRRFLAKREAGAKHFVVGVECLIEQMTDEEAKEASLVENLEPLRKKMNPIARAKTLNELIAFSTTGLRGMARRLGVAPMTLSDWLRPLELTEPMQEAISKGRIPHSDWVKLARLKLGTELQNELAEVAEMEGTEAFRKELKLIDIGEKKRGIPKGVYIILRTTFDKRYKPDLEVYEKLTDLAKQKDMALDEYCKWVLSEHIKTAG